MNQHIMVLAETNSSADEWYCPTCGRRLLMVNEPGVRKTVLETGDEFAIHSGGKGIVKQARPVDSLTSTGKLAFTLDAPTLAPWLTWLEKTDFENLWNDAA